MLHVLNVGFDLYLVVTKDEFNKVITAYQRSCGKVMFSQLCVCCLSGDAHVTITHDALDLTVQPTPSPSYYVW